MTDAMRTTWAQPGESAWNDALRVLDHDIYSTPSFVEAHAAEGGGTPVAWTLTNGAGSPVALVPLVEREIPGGGEVDATSPYGYPGVSSAPEMPARRLLQRLDEDARERGLVTTFLRLHPIQNSALIEEPGLPWWTSPRRQTTAVDLDTDRSVDARLSKTSRYEIRRASREGMEVVDGTMDLHAWSEFQYLYAKAMAERDARSDLRFGPEYFTYLREDAQFRLYVARLDRRIVAAATFSFAGRICQYHLAADDGVRRPFSSMRCIIREAINEAQIRGLEWVHLGGGLSAGEDSLLRFKRSMSDTELVFRGLGLTHRELPHLPAAVDTCSFYPHYRCVAHGL